MTHKREIRKEIVRRHADGETSTAIERATGIHHDTVRRWWREDRPRAIDQFLTRPAPGQTKETA